MEAFREPDWGYSEIHLPHIVMVYIYINSISCIVTVVFKILTQLLSELLCFDGVGTPNTLETGYGMNYKSGIMHISVVQA